MSFAILIHRPIGLANGLGGLANTNSCAVIFDSLTRSHQQHPKAVYSLRFTRLDPVCARRARNLVLDTQNAVTMVGCCRMGAA
jgi:hypothetical protein